LLWMPAQVVAHPWYVARVFALHVKHVASRLGYVWHRAKRIDGAPRCAGAVALLKDLLALLFS
jgi:hypothetical protein